MTYSRFDVLILARGGSKSIPKKNLIKLGNKPIIAYPIISAKNSDMIKDVYVSTDDNEIKNASLEYGAKVIDRPADLAQDDSLDIDSMRHAVEYLDKYEDFIHLRATTPLVNTKVIDGAIRYFLNNDDCTSLRSAHEVSFPPEKMFRKKGKYWKGLYDLKHTEMPRQKFEKTYKPNGYVDIVRPKHFMKNDSLHGNKILCYVTKHTHDIDSYDDYEMIKKEYNNETI